MPRGVKGSGKARKPAGEPGQPRRRGGKPKEPLPAPNELPFVAPPVEELTDAEPAEDSQAKKASVKLSSERPPPKVNPLQAMPARPAQAPELAAVEAELARKYPQQKMKPGSLLPSGATAEFGKKRPAAERDARPARLPMTEALLGALRQASQDVDVPAARLLLACLARAASRKRRRPGTAQTPDKGTRKPRRKRTSEKPLDPSEEAGNPPDGDWTDNGGRASDTEDEGQVRDSAAGAAGEPMPFSVPA